LAQLFALHFFKGLLPALRLPWQKNRFLATGKHGAFCKLQVPSPAQDMPMNVPYRFRSIETQKVDTERMTGFRKWDGHNERQELLATAANYGFTH
jgi:hypothetical protein